MRFSAYGEREAFNRIKECGLTVCKNRPTEEWWHNTGSLKTSTKSKEHTEERCEAKCQGICS